MNKKNFEIKTIFVFVTVLFTLFLIVPMCFVLIKSVMADSGGLGFEHYIDVFTSKGFLQAVGRSFLVSSVSAVITVVLAFIIAYAVNNTNLPNPLKKIISITTVFPMLLPTITYGFAIIYSLGKKGLITEFLGLNVEIYGFRGLVLGYVIYTLPIAFMLINNTFKYIDKKFIIVSRVMGDSPLQTFFITCIRPIIGTLGAAFVQSFFLSFTDFGIPAAIGGEYTVVASTLYNEMLGSAPNFGNGAVVALVMLIPSILSIILLNRLEKYNFRYNTSSNIGIEKNKVRDFIVGILSVVILICVLSVFVVIFIIPFVESWPYKKIFSIEHIIEFFKDTSLFKIYLNSLLVSLLTALCGTLIAYGAALVTSRSTLSRKSKQVVESIALIINTIPGMVLGIAFMLVFSGTSLRNTFFLIVVCNIVHFFSTPYLMMKNSLSKMCASWETTAMLMGDNWFKTIVRVVTPNAKFTIMEVFSYYFINAMVTISAVIFIVGARTMVITTKIKELQHYAKFDDIFTLSLLILATNLIVKGIFAFISKSQEKRKEKR